MLWQESVRQWQRGAEKDRESQIGKDMGSVSQGRKIAEESRGQRGAPLCPLLSFSDPV